MKTLFLFTIQDQKIRYCLLIKSKIFKSRKYFIIDFSNQISIRWYNYLSKIIHKIYIAPYNKSAHGPPRGFELTT